MIRTAIICAFVVMVCNITVQAYNENWVEGGDTPYGVLQNSWGQSHTGNFLWYNGDGLLEFNSSVTWLPRCAVVPPGNNYFQEVRVMGLVNADASNDTSVYDLSDSNQVDHGFYGHSNQWSEWGYTAMLEWQNDGVYLEVGRNWGHSTLHMSSGDILVPGSTPDFDPNVGNYDFSYWLVLDITSEVNPIDPLTLDMTATGRVWASEEAYYNQEPMLCSAEIFDPSLRTDPDGRSTWDNTRETEGRSGLIALKVDRTLTTGPVAAHYSHVSSTQLNERIKGDFTHDGQVDQADYTIWADTYGQTGPALDADMMGNADGVVDQADYTIWADNYGNTAWSEPNAVPEPATMTLLTLAGLALLRRK